MGYFKNDAYVFELKDGAWPAELEYLRTEKFLAFAKYRQEIAVEERVENGWWTGWNVAMNAPEYVDVPPDGQHAGLDFQSFKPEYQPTRIMTDRGLVRLVWHHAHGVAAANPSDHDLGLSVSQNADRAEGTYVYFAQVGRLPDLDGTGGAEFYYNLFGPPKMFPGLPPAPLDGGPGV